MTSREFRLPDLGEGLTESDIVAWHVAEGDRVELNQIIADVETAKALVELPAPYAGVVTALHAREGETVSVGAPLVTFELADTGAETDADEPAPPNLVGYGATVERSGRPQRRSRARATTTVATSRPVDERRPERQPSTPPVRVLARRLGVDLESLTGTGEHGLVTRADVEAAAGSVAPGPTATTTTTTTTTTGDTRIPISGVRKHTAAAMVASAFTAPHVTEFLTVDVTPTMDLLTRLREHPLAEGTRITLLALVAHAVCEALGRHPSLNSSWDEKAQEIVQHGSVNLGIAAATERGLIVPNIPDAASLGVLELANALTDLTTVARSGRTSVERLRGGTFTITNIGVFGIDAGTPIINPGEAAILAVGAVVRRPWEYRGEIALREVLTLSLSFDHRLVDGEQGSRFLAEVGALLAEPGLALLSGGPR
ncbi:dihydrolipoamide acetyltransferase family protein [Pseudolysinimonas yzui]|uniref:Dihydrolipoamide acetyltransferase component of pyruvate dehydrogenase complex n=1 Tax=Pseudolysinimonas yzui TaxID=2708254 RepID=A0A8J3GSQ8_9MICO|nr:dihydrolipoamide acetyltransferase family protein [Pseudolysinimonas yzui]GHF25815.1 dihydrolipoamide acetyltransferase component of pyruvate dehydrogenase complex [Pseudolysinimonas yzui]